MTHPNETIDKTFNALAEAARTHHGVAPGYSITKALKDSGYVIVPLEPTARMISEGESAASFGIGKPVDDEALPRVWRAMLEASSFHKGV